MVPARGNGHGAFRCRDWRTAIRLARQEHGVFLERFLAIRRTDGEDCWERELQLLNGHGLDAHAEVERRDRNLGDFLKRPYKCLCLLVWIIAVFGMRCACLLLDENLLDANTGDDQVAVRLCDMVDHLDGSFLLMW